MTVRKNIRRFPSSKQGNLILTQILNSTQFPFFLPVKAYFLSGHAGLRRGAIKKAPDYQPTAACNFSAQTLRRISLSRPAKPGDTTLVKAPEMNEGARPLSGRQKLTVNPAGCKEGRQALQPAWSMSKTRFRARRNEAAAAPSFQPAEKACGQKAG